jgi:hypothetical protein
MTNPSDDPNPSAQKRAEDAHERLQDDVNELIRREVDNAVGHGNWSGDVGPPLVAAFEETFVGVLRQLIENADDADTRRPAIALVEVIGADSGTDFVVFPGYWRPDGAWRDANLGPGGEALCERIVYDLTHTAAAGALRVQLTIYSFDGEMVSRTYLSSEVPDRPADLVLPRDPKTLGEDLRSQIRRTRERAAEQLEAKGWDSAARDVRAGFTPLAIIRRVEREARDLSARARALPILLSLEEDLERIADAD